MKKVKCPKCLGTGLVQDQVSLGQSLRRKRNGRLLKEVARAMGITPSHLCYLEQGKRRWTPELIDKHHQACKK